MRFNKVSRLIFGLSVKNNSFGLARSCLKDDKRYFAYNVASDMISAVRVLAWKVLNVTTRGLLQRYRFATYCPPRSQVSRFGIKRYLGSCPGAPQNNVSDTFSKFENHFIFSYYISV